VTWAKKNLKSNNLALFWGNIIFAMRRAHRDNEFGMAVIAMRGPQRDNVFGKAVIMYTPYLDLRGPHRGHKSKNKLPLG